MAIGDRGGGWDRRSETVVVKFPVVNGEETGYDVGVVAFGGFPRYGEVIEYTTASECGFCCIPASRIATCVCEFVWRRKSLNIGNDVERSRFGRKNNEDELDNKYSGRKYEDDGFQESSLWRFGTGEFCIGVEEGCLRGSWQSLFMGHHVVDVSFFSGKNTNQREVPPPR